MWTSSIKLCAAICLISTELCEGFAGSPKKAFRAWGSSSTLVTSRGRCNNPCLPLVGRTGSVISPTIDRDNLEKLVSSSAEVTKVAEDNEADELVAELELLRRTISSDTGHIAEDVEMQPVRQPDTAVSTIVSGPSTMTDAGYETLPKFDPITDTGLGVWVSRGLLAGVAALYGTNFGCVKLLEESVPISLAAALRFSVALVPFLPSLVRTSPAVLKAGIEIGVVNAVGYWAQSQSLMTTTASKSAFICSLAVVLVPLLDSAFTKLMPGVDEQRGDRQEGLGEGEQILMELAPPSVSTGLTGEGWMNILDVMDGPWFPAIMATLGVACLELTGGDGGPTIGDLWAMVQPICFGLGFWRTEHFTRQFPDDTLGLVAAQLLAVVALSLMWCIQAGDIPASLGALWSTLIAGPVAAAASNAGLTLHTEWYAVPLALLWTGLVTTAITVYGETVAMKSLSAAESTVIFSTEPLWGAAFAAALLGESVGWNTGVGAIFIVAACAWSSVGPMLRTTLGAGAAAAAAGGVVAEGEMDAAELWGGLNMPSLGGILKEIVEHKSNWWWW